MGAGMENGELTFWDPSKILAGADAAESLILRNTQHTGPVPTLDFNPAQSNLLASGDETDSLFGDIDLASVTKYEYFCVTNVCRLDRVFSCKDCITTYITKLTALLQNLRRLREQDPSYKAVVFSQFTSFLDLIEMALEREKIDKYRYDGAKRNAESKKPKVLCVSLKAGGVGLNLTTADHVFMMDWWNVATENQAIDRVHRLGQDNTVYVKRFIISDTVEDCILNVQKRKTAIVTEALKGGRKGTGDPESIENLKIMFGSREVGF
ncbi:hypothetical protein K435DRAFT_802135 [Dendrothele bispora CBS 962.96]|uniref:Helicase C-terminal domain-containing protein n=1 Tax=Dendrothele bispora (strain CBS 962.96) TaxID=1314807 RepID=A0A4V4HE93_DENBC|nr:hypothetical protein K435DRAFT_802135 [Dendrothele bispora CBS 962.96]